MKYIRKLLILGLVTFIFEGSFLFYIDKYYLGDEQAIKIQGNTATTVEAKTKKLTAKLPEGYKDFKISYDGSYVSYFEGQTLKIVSMKDGKVNEINFDKDTKQSYYGWLEDRNRIIITEKKQKAKKDIVKFYHYDVKTQEKVEVKDFINDREVYLDLDSSSAEVSKIEFNTLNTIIFPKIKVSEKESQIYRVDATAPIEQIKTYAKSIGDIHVVKNIDKVAYEDTANKKVYLSGNKTPISIKGVENYKLLSVDEQSKIYIGSLEGNKITNIYYKDGKDKEDNWINVSLPNPTEAEKIYITPNGDIYINDSSKHVITNLSNLEEVNYNGVILGVYNGGYIVKDNNLEITSLSFK